jgi:hypothetical protein
MLYLLFATVSTVYDGDEGSVVAYFDQELRWHKLFFKRFTEWTDDPTLATICSFDLFERDDPPEYFAPPVGCEVREARDDELPATCTLTRAHLPQITADAFDVHPTSIRRTTTSREHRGRQVLVLRQDGPLAGVALCDTGDPNVSLFNIVNMAQIYLRMGARTPSTDAQRALISAARAFYAARSPAGPMLVSPPGTLRGAAEPGTRLVEKMGCIVSDDFGLADPGAIGACKIARRGQGALAPVNSRKRELRGCASKTMTCWPRTKRRRARFRRTIYRLRRRRRSVKCRSVGKGGFDVGIWAAGGAMQIITINR